MYRSVHDDWERLVRATLKREELIWLSRQDSLSTCSSSLSASSNFHLEQSSIKIRDRSGNFFEGNSILSNKSFMLGDSFTYQQVLHATNGFSKENLMKRGHSGDIYRGILEDGVSVAIKKIDLNKRWYFLELECFIKVSSSPRLVPLLGYCLEDENDKFLVYKHMPNGDLSSLLFKETSSDDGLQPLDWITRLKIAIGAAEGLSYLHHECSPRLVHRDVQASSILVDDKFEVRIGSLSEVCAQQAGSTRSMIRRLLRLPKSSEQGSSGTPNATCAYDVYCFGKVLLNLVTGTINTNEEYLDTTLRYISIFDPLVLITNIIDPLLIVDEDLLEEVWAMALIAKACLNPEHDQRPLMHDILKALEDPLMAIGWLKDMMNTRPVVLHSDGKF